MQYQQENTPYKFLYRVQGGNLSKPTIIIGKDFSVKSMHEHLFVSKTREHHTYYVGKRVIQYIQKYVMKEQILPYHKNWKEHHVAEQICERLEDINTFKDPLYLLEMMVPTELYYMIEENSLSTMMKHTHPMKYWLPKKIDELRLEGGYHVSELWLQLLMDSILTLQYKEITRNDLYAFLKETKNILTNHPVQFENLVQTLTASTIYHTNEDYQKKIETDLEQIWKKGAYLENTSFGCHSYTSIQNREKVMQYRMK